MHPPSSEAQAASSLDVTVMVEPCPWMPPPALYVFSPRAEQLDIRLDSTVRIEASTNMPAPPDSDVQSEKVLPFTVTKEEV